METDVAYTLETTTYEENGHDPMQVLREAFEAQDVRLFARQAKAMDWSARTPEDVVWAIKNAINLNASLIAIKLAEQCAPLFPDDTEVQHWYNLFCTKKRAWVVDGPNIKGQRETHAWFDKHADDYVGQWVAVNQGNLVAAAKTYEELQELIAHVEDRVSTVIRRVL